MSDTKIEWADATWNPVRGCSRVSAGCDNCYAMRMAHRMNHSGGAYEGLTRYSTTMGRKDGKPYGIDHTKHQGIDWSSKVRFVPDKLGEPLKWRKPRRVFVCSMGDLFHEKLTNHEIAAVFGVMAYCQRHVFQVLTKRPARMGKWFDWVARAYTGLFSRKTWPNFVATVAAQDMLTASKRGHKVHVITGQPWPLPNVWLGVTAENQAMADERVPLLLQTPAAVRFVSVEPMLEDVQLAQWLSPLRNKSDGPVLGWIIAGCESGTQARAAETAWFRGLLDECEDNATPFFLKQMKVDGKLAKMPELDGRVWDEVPR